MSTPQAITVAPRSIGERIKQARKSRGMSQADLALRVGVSQPAIANWESGVHDPRRLTLAKLADAHGFISNMSLGYEQLVGERGVGLSGGQLQRLCIARALYHDPRLLVFDEATSALDTQSESNILRNMQDILKGRTGVVIAHRLSTIMSADKILVLYNGCVIEEGHHEELVNRKGMYYQLVKKQISNA